MKTYISCEDFNRYYSNTSLYLKGKLIYVKKGEDSGNSQYRIPTYEYLETPRVDTYVTGTPIIIDFSGDLTEITQLHAKTGFYNLPQVRNKFTTPYFITKSGNKQYKKSFCVGLYKAHLAFRDFDKVCGGSLFAGHLLDNSIEAAWTVTHNVYPTYVEACRTIKSEPFVLGLALSLEYALTEAVHSKNSDFTLWWRTVPIAGIKGKHVTVIDSDFEQEVKDFVRFTGEILNVH